ncbi:MAG: orotate phosphoribosyltransferase [Treponema sp.]|jgi:orotate phosphoribosyltransferase|nr:orotate phosphoribosyltransferase [Treponema sp.]
MIISLLKETGAMLDGHFLLSSGCHSDIYFQCARLLQYPDKARSVIAPIAERIRADIDSGILSIDAVVGPAIGGITAAYEMGRQLGVRAFWTERDDCGAMALRRGFEIDVGQNVLIMEDVVTTAKSSLETARVLESLGAKVTALACIVDRRSGERARPLPFHAFYAAVRIEAVNWNAEECPLCGKGLPLAKPGSRKQGKV